MAAIRFVEHQITARVPELGNATNVIDAGLTIRVDPLTGHTARILHQGQLAPSARTDLTDLTTPPPFCPFCADKLEVATGVIAPSITDEGRIRRGASAVVPNVLAYSEFSSVGLYDTTRHFVGLRDLTPQLIGDLFVGLVAYARGVGGLRPMWHSINANYLPPAGSSVVHPHAQTAHDDIGTTAQRNLVAASERWPGNFWHELVEQEAGGPRWLGTRGRVHVLTPWAPIGFHEVWLLIPELHDILELTDDDCADLGAVLSGVLMGYDALDLASFNWALYGGGPSPSSDFGLLLRIVSRANPEPVYRSDVTYFERLHAEAMIDMGPEEVAKKLAPHLAAVLG
ncbi:hypothetical protein [Granulicoccus sp. GXG6511]|uniref:hypothetical protein n=1 Tax=Granulicoccus sp. GXG6511 TaxID=3381351 RepID=UPI003D7EF61D